MAWGITSTVSLMTRSFKDAGPLSVAAFICIGTVSVASLVKRHACPSEERSRLRLAV